MAATCSHRLPEEEDEDEAAEDHSKAHNPAAFHAASESPLREQGEPHCHTCKSLKYQALYKTNNFGVCMCQASKRNAGQLSVHARRLLARPTRTRAAAQWGSRVVARTMTTNNVAAEFFATLTPLVGKNALSEERTCRPDRNGNTRRAAGHRCSDGRKRWERTRSALRQGRRVFPEVPNLFKDGALPHVRLCLLRCLLQGPPEE